MSNKGNSDDEFDNWNDEAPELEQKKEGQDSRQESEYNFDDVIGDHYEEELNKIVILIHIVV